MCGILGLIRFNGSASIDTGLFKQALDLQKHRGPDDSDSYSDKNVMLGHRRLSIIDLQQHAKQPMISSCGNYVLVFNGEIYNYEEIRKNLTAIGYVFKTDSDSEVLLNAFIEFGIEAVNQFIGMFSFCFYDRLKEEFHLVRDRLGIKPLYYEISQDGIIFSSEIKSILKLSSCEKSINIEALSSYFTFRYPILDDTFFTGVHTLPPAHYMKISKDEVEIIEYWNLAPCFKKQQEDKGEEYYIAEIKRVLESAVSYRMISDVPIGCFLSGGVDSSVIAAIMSSKSSERVNTFTIGFNETGYNEFEYASQVAKQYNTNHTEITLSGDNYLNAMEELIKIKDSPLSVPNEVPLYLMSKEMKKTITVVLSGEGADEIFGGYGRIFRSPYDLERNKLLDNSQLPEKQKAQFKKDFLLKYGVSNIDSELEHFFKIYAYTSLDDKCDLLNSKLNLKSIEDKLISKISEYFEELGDDSYENKMMYVFEKVHLLGLLHRVDTSTMAASVEARVPFVDHRLVELAFTIPLKYKLKWTDKSACTHLMSDKISEVYDTPKYILKKAYEDKLSNDILYRKKMGFPVPLNEWFGGEFKKNAIDILLSDEAKSRNIYNIAELEKRLTSKELAENHGFAMKIWNLMNVEIFMKNYF